MINSDRVSLFTVATGPRGSGKTLLMTSIVCQRLLKAYFLNNLKGMNNKVYSNYPVKFLYRSPIEDNKVITLESLPLNMEAFYTFDDALNNSWVFIDEIDQWYDRQDWAAITQKLMNKAITQIRKKKMNMMATLQDLDWLNSRGQFQADIHVKCREAAFSPWGRRLGLDLGEASFTSWMDLSGVMTGYQYKETGRDFRNTFWGKRFWNYYNTNFQFNPLEQQTKYKLKRKEKIIDLTGEMPDDTDTEIVRTIPAGLTSSRKNRDEVLLAQIVDDIRNSDVKKMKSTEFWQRAKEKGVSGAPIVLGRYVTSVLGVGKNGRGDSYVFEKELARV